MELIIRRLQAKEAEIAQYLSVIEDLQKQLVATKEELDVCTKNLNQNQNPKKEKVKENDKKN